MDKYCELDASATAAVREVASRVAQMTTRGHDTLLKVARTVADLNNSWSIYKKHIVEAADLCGHEEVRDFLAAQGDAALCQDCGAEVGSSDRFCRQCGHAVGHRTQAGPEDEGGGFGEDATPSLSRQATLQS